MIEEEMKEEIKEEMETHAGPEEGKFVTLCCVMRLKKTTVFLKN